MSTTASGLGYTPEKLRAGLESDRAKFQAFGVTTSNLGLIDKAETAELAFRTLLTAKPRDCVLIGAGVRTHSRIPSAV